MPQTQDVCCLCSKPIRRFLGVADVYTVMLDAVTLAAAHGRCAAPLSSCGRHFNYRYSGEACPRCQTPEGMAAAPLASAEGASAAPLVTREQGLTAAGLFCVCVGLYFLIVAPSQGSVDVMGHELDIVNLQRLTLGETFTISGVVLLAAAWRPRS